jgi:uncharacterized membrane protein YheB (UPF0754 family)
VHFCVVCGRVYLCCKMSCIFVLLVIVYICGVLTTHKYMTTYNTYIHDHLQQKIHEYIQHKYTRTHTTQICTTNYNRNIHDHLKRKNMATYNTYIHDHLQHIYSPPLTTHISTTTYNTYIHDHLQHKYPRPLTTQIYTTSGRPYLCCKWSCKYVL